MTQEGGQLAFVKPHGALYNDMVKNGALADAVIDTIKRIDPNLPLMGLAGSDLDKGARQETYHSLQRLLLIGATAITVN